MHPARHIETQQFLVRRGKALLSNNYETRWNPPSILKHVWCTEPKKNAAVVHHEYDTRNIDASFSMCMKRQLETSSLMKRKETKEEG